MVFYVFVELVAWKPDMPPVFGTIELKDKRLPTKTRIIGFNVGDDYACVAEDFVKSGKNGTRNMILGGKPLVASYDKDSDSLGIFVRPSTKAITQPVDVHGKIKGNKNGEKLHRLNTVKNGVFWFVWVNFFPQTDVNPEK